MVFFHGETRFVDSGEEGGRGEVPSSHRIKGTYCQQVLNTGDVDLGHMAWHL